MNRKTKKQVTTVVVLLFFLTAGVWYFFQSDVYKEMQENEKELTGVLELTETTMGLTQPPEEKSPEEPAENSKELVVYVCGAVNEPGIYTLAADSRLYEAIAMAGGFSAEADPAYHNLARTITDGERIYILSASETSQLTAEQQVTGEEGTVAEVAKATGLINLNTATAEQLMELPGIGEAKAAGILEYRAQIGQFKDIEEIMNVSGIGEAMFEKIKSKITVK